MLMELDKGRIMNDYGKIKKLEDELVACNKDVLGTAKLMLKQAIAAGKLLNAKKESLPHGEFGKWVAENTSYSRGAAWNYMCLAKNEEAVLAEATTISGALRLLDPPKPG